MGSAPSVLSMVRVTSARPSGGREEVPAKTTSSIRPPRRGLTPCSPMTQEKASTTFDLPDPFGPTTQVMPGSNRNVVAEAKDLNPRRVRVFRYTCGLSSSSGTPSRERAAGQSLRTLPLSSARPVPHAPLRAGQNPRPVTTPGHGQAEGNMTVSDNFHDHGSGTAGYTATRGSRTHVGPGGE